MEATVAVVVLALVSLVCVGTLAHIAIRVAYALTALSSRESAEVLSDMVKPAEKPRKQEVIVPPDLANPSWSTEYARDMTDVADPNRNGVT